MNIFSRFRNSSWPSPSCDYQMNGIDIRLGYTNLQGILDGKRTICYESISDILISMFSGINKCLQGHNIFVIDFSSSRYQKFIISLICISAEFPAYSEHLRWLGTGVGAKEGPAIVVAEPGGLPKSLPICVGDIICLVFFLFLVLGAIC